jgi:hypothetical protein
MYAPQTSILHSDFTPLFALCVCMWRPMLFYITAFPNCFNPHIHTQTHTHALITEFACSGYFQHPYVQNTEQQAYVTRTQVSMLNKLFKFTLLVLYPWNRSGQNSVVIQWIQMCWIWSVSCWSGANPGYKAGKCITCNTVNSNIQFRESSCKLLFLKCFHAHRKRNWSNKLRIMLPNSDSIKQCPS